MVTGFLICVMIVLRGFPETALARWLDRTLVAAVRRITRTHVIFLVLMSVILIAGTELLAMAGPFDMALVLMWDVSAYIDIVLTTVVVAGAARGGAGWRMVTQRLRSGIVRRTGRARRSRSTAKAARKRANDDDRPAFARAA